MLYMLTFGWDGLLFLFGATAKEPSHAIFYINNLLSSIADGFRCFLKCISFFLQQYFQYRLNTWDIIHQCLAKCLVFSAKRKKRIELRRNFEFSIILICLIFTLRTQQHRHRPRAESTERYIYQRQLLMAPEFDHCEHFAEEGFAALMHMPRN